jgi:hypothetical protein
MCQVAQVDGQAGVHLVAFDVKRYEFRPARPLSSSVV